MQTSGEDLSILGCLALYRIALSVLSVPPASPPRLRCDIAVPLAGVAKASITVICEVMECPSRRVIQDNVALQAFEPSSRLILWMWNKEYALLHCTDIHIPANAAKTGDGKGNKRSQDKRTGREAKRQTPGGPPPPASQPRRPEYHLIPFVALGKKPIHHHRCPRPQLLDTTRHPSWSLYMGAPPIATRCFSDSRR